MGIPGFSLDAIAMLRQFLLAHGREHAVVAEAYRRMRRMLAWAARTQTTPDGFLKRDPNLKATYTGPAAGPGASYAWEGNKDVGKGRMTVARSTSPSRVEMDLAFIEPIQGDNLAVFTLEPASSGGTQVTWAMSGKAPFITKLIGIFMPMDKMIGPDFESGLAGLKALAEQPN